MVPVSGSNTADQLDVMLAERVIAGGLRGQRLMESRQRRDVRWIIGALGGRGVHVTECDVEACLQATSGRFLPGQPEHGLIRGMRAAIDHLETRAEYGMLPNGKAMVQLYDLLTADLFGLANTTLRAADPWEILLGIDYPQPAELKGQLARFHRECGYLVRLPLFDALHPVGQAAMLLHQFVRIAPFRDFNLLVGGLAASWYLLAYGYPPFLPQAVDGATMRLVLAGKGGRTEEWFSEIVLVGYRTIVA
ncbi:MAG: hypothetical protein CMJ85_11620 [Planctomycetes bacterium]|jgi:hypothetical protein|nr:hypothetical protein [Planctomycetota bacterium]MDP6424797.1 Fic family protein [Planctomycetota bacterium]